MIRTYVVHVVVGDEPGDDVVGVLEDVLATERIQFRTGAELLTQLVARSARHSSQR